jgi:hypothetical protein
VAVPLPLALPVALLDILTVIPTDEDGVQSLVLRMSLREPSPKVYGHYVEQIGFLCFSEVQDLIADGWSVMTTWMDVLASGDRLKDRTVEMEDTKQSKFGIKLLRFVLQKQCDIRGPKHRGGGHVQLRRPERGAPQGVRQRRQGEPHQLHGPQRQHTQSERFLQASAFCSRHTMAGTKTGLLAMR